MVSSSSTLAGSSEANPAYRQLEGGLSPALQGEPWMAGDEAINALLHDAEACRRPR